MIDSNERFLNKLLWDSMKDPTSNQEMVELALSHIEVLRWLVKQRKRCTNKRVRWYWVSQTAMKLVNKVMIKAANAGSPIPSSLVF